MAACAALTAPRLQACKGATAEFARISAAIRAVEDELKADGGDAGLAAWVRKLQQAEQSKLQLTVGMQVPARRSARALAAQHRQRAGCDNPSAFAPGAGSHARPPTRTCQAPILRCLSVFAAWRVEPSLALTRAASACN